MISVRELIRQLVERTIEFDKPACIKIVKRNSNGAGVSIKKVPIQNYLGYEINVEYSDIVAAIEETI